MPNYVEPFYGSGAVLLGRPDPTGVETVNDIDAYVSNFWRALAQDPEQVAWWADYPVSEPDLHARHLWLVNREEFRERMKTDPDYFDAKIAGWWVWGLSMWIGSGWCVPKEWRRENGMDPNTSNLPRKQMAPGRSGRAVHSQIANGRRPSLRFGSGVTRKLPAIAGNHGSSGKGVHRSKPDISGCRGATGRGVHSARLLQLTDYFEDLAARLRRVRVCCGDWKRILGPSPTFHIGVTGVFLDPPYGEKAGRKSNIYSNDNLQVAGDVRDWAVENGDNPLLRIALCGYSGEHDMPKDWSVVAWKTNGGYGRISDKGRANCARERIWFSPGCLNPEGKLTTADFFNHG